MEKSKKTRKSLTIQQKQDIITRREAGETTGNLAREYGVNHSTISTIFAKKETIKNANVSHGICRLCDPKKRSHIVTEMEKLLYIWIKNQRRCGLPVSQEWIRMQARIMYIEIRNEQQDPDLFVDFKASKNWFRGFRDRTGIHSAITHGESGSANKEAADKFVVELNELIKTLGMQSRILN